MGIIIKYGVNLHIGGLSPVLGDKLYVKNGYIPQNYICPSIGGMSSVLETNMSPIRGTFSPSGESMKNVIF